MQNSGLSPLEGVCCCSREKPALALEATGLSANRGPRKQEGGQNPQQDFEICIWQNRD